MGVATGENEQAMRKILDMSRFIALALLALHDYYYCYGFFKSLGFVSGFSDRLLHNIIQTGLFENFHRSKLLAIGFLIISMMGIKGRKKENLHLKVACGYMLAGLILYFGTYFLWNLN